jgi:hypothetical protein
MAQGPGCKQDAAKVLGVSPSSSWQYSVRRCLVAAGPVFCWPKPGISGSTPRTFGPIGQNRVRRWWLNSLAPAQSRLRLQNSTKLAALPSWRTYLVWPQVSPQDQNQTLDFVCRDFK